MSTFLPQGGRLPPDREALLRTTLALSVDERVAWLEAMIAIALESRRPARSGCPTSSPERGTPERMNDYYRRC